MKRLLVVSLLLIGLITFCLRCSSESNDLDKANEELHYVRIAITAGLADAGTTQLDSAVTAWDGSLGKVTATSKDAVVYDAASYLSPQRRLSKATYDISQAGLITDAHNISWIGVEFDATYPQVSHWVKAP